MPTGDRNTAAARGKRNSLRREVLALRAERDRLLGEIVALRAERSGNRKDVAAAVRKRPDLKRRGRPAAHPSTQILVYAFVQAHLKRGVREGARELKRRLDQCCVGLSLSDERLRKIYYAGKTLAVKNSQEVAEYIKAFRQNPDALPLLLVAKEGSEWRSVIIDADAVRSRKRKMLQKAGIAVDPSEPLPIRITGI